jgi:hypothetical protein
MSTKNGNGTQVTEEATIKLRRLERVTFEIPIQGTAPLIANRWSEKAKEIMLSAQQSSARTKKAPKDPVANFEAARYRFPDGRDGFPATAFKAAIVHAGRMFDGITQVALKQMVVVTGEQVGQEQLVPLDFGEVIMREDTVRNASGVADLRYRPQYAPWSATLKVKTIAGQFDIESLFALVDAAGIGGVGEWRPTAPKSATGTFGTFEVIG